MATANVWTMSEPLGNGLAVINDFVDDYHRNKKGYYKRLAKRVQVICRNNTRDIQALITYRAKKKKSLRKKLENMNEKRLREGLPPFQTRQEIEEQLVDLAGVRIALYFPQEKQRVQEEIGNWFPSVVWKKKPGYSKKTGEEGQYRSGQGPLEDSDSCNADASTGTNENGSYNRVFAGYVADHFHVKISKIQSERPKKLEEWMEHHVVEIQVVSVLLHAWAEVEHDIEYKQIRAKAGNEEKVILDALNGSIMSAELLLNQLHTIHTNRVQSMKEPFPDKFALARCLDGYIGGVLDDSEKNNLELKMLFGLLKALQKNSHQELHRVLKELGFEENNKLTDLRKLGNGFSDLVESTDPFLLARHMHIPFYIMKRIVSQMTAREERAARRRAIQEERKAQERAGRGGEPNTSYKCRVLLSCFVWMGQLSLGGSLDRVMQKVQLRLADDEERNAFEWPFSAPARFNILVNGEETSEEDANDMDVIWDWFERQEEHSLFSFVFRISRLGVVGSFPDDLTLLRKEDYSRHESSSY